MDRHLHRPRLCAAIVDRLTFDAHIIQTGADSYRLRSAKPATRPPAPEPAPAEVTAMLIAQPGSDYQLTQITLDAGHARDITLLLTDLHGLLADLCLDPARPQLTTLAHAILTDCDSPYTPQALLGALDQVITQLTYAVRDALSLTQPPPPPGARSLGELPAPHRCQWGRIRREQWSHLGGLTRIS